MTPLEALQLVGALLQSIVIVTLALSYGWLLARVRRLERAQTTITLHGVQPSQITVTEGPPPPPAPPTSPSRPGH